MISFDDIRKAYGPIKAVDGLSLELRVGEIFGLLGPNGAGKTTTVHMAAGLLRPDAGEVQLHGEGSPELPEVRSKIGHAPQALALYDNLSGEENIAFFGKLQGLSGKRLRERTDWCLEFVDLTERRRDRVKRYSGGMRRRLNLAVALVHDPGLLLLDEPTAGVDPQSRNAIYENVQAFRAQGRTILYTTHYMEEAQRLCDRVGIMDRGRLLAMDSVSNLIIAHGGKSMVTAVWPDREEQVETDDPVREFNRFKSDPALVGLHVDKPTLERVFLNLTGRQLRDNS
jgi:ABC-2 type transport system ATP-binding protein